jgi:hypothetical protein
MARFPKKTLSAPGKRNRFKGQYGSSGDVFPTTKEGEREIKRRNAKERGGASGTVYDAGGRSGMRRAPGGNYYCSKCGKGFTLESSRHRHQVRMGHQPKLPPSGRK